MPDEPVEIKVNLADATEAIDTLQLTDGDPRRIYFLEDRTPGLGTRYPLLTAGVVLRLRAEADGAGDYTVKLRPCRRTQLVDEWRIPDDTDEGWSYRIEGDWTGERRVLAASLVTDLAADEIASALEAPEEAFSLRQLSFVRTCTNLPLGPAALTVLGPVAATKWSKVRVGEVRKVNAERWQVGGLDFLELSRKVDADEAAAALSELVRAAESIGLTVDANLRSKTEQVLDVLTELS
jgi:hypothetical protein